MWYKALMVTAPWILPEGLLGGSPAHVIFIWVYFGAHIVAHATITIWTSSGLSASFKCASMYSQSLYCSIQILSVSRHWGKNLDVITWTTKGKNVLMVLNIILIDYLSLWIYLVLNRNWEKAESLGNPQN